MNHKPQPFHMQGKTQTGKLGRNSRTEPTKIPHLQLINTNETPSTRKHLLDTSTGKI